MEVLTGEKKIKISKIISVKEAMINPELKSKIGTFKEEDTSIESL